MSRELTLEEALDIPFTFSPNCHVGILSSANLDRCECGRCRLQRGEPVTDETEALAAANAKKARAGYDEWMRGFLAKWHGKAKQ